jgi:hypothetical protein
MDSSFVSVVVQSVILPNVVTASIYPIQLLSSKKNISDKRGKRTFVKKLSKSLSQGFSLQPGANVIKHYSSKLPR